MAEAPAHGDQRLFSLVVPQQGSGCRADAAVRKSMRPAQRTMGPQALRAGDDTVQDALC